MLLALECTIMFECERVPPIVDRVLQHSFYSQCLLIYVICTQIVVFERYIRFPAVFCSFKLFAVRKTALVLSRFIELVPHDAVIRFVVNCSTGCVQVWDSGDQLVFLGIVIFDWVVRSWLYLW